MKKLGKIRSLSIYILSFLLLILKYAAFLIAGWTAVLLFVIGLAVFLVLSVLIIIHLVEIFRKRNYQFKSFITILLFFLIAFIIIYEPVEYYIEKSKSPVNLHGYCEHTVTMTSILCREDNTFEYNAGAFLDRDIYYGKYKVQNDTIFLSFSPDSCAYLNDTLLLSDDYLIEFGDLTRHRHRFKLTKNELK